MRINQYVATTSGLSRRAVDKAIGQGRVKVNGQLALIGQSINSVDKVTLDNKLLSTEEKILLLVNKPVGVVCSRNGQGAKTIYEILPENYQHLKTMGRLDKDSMGLILLTNDGELADRLTHPKYEKKKVYEITLSRPLLPEDMQKIEDGKVFVDGSASLMKLRSTSRTGLAWEITMSEGKNRQIRRTMSKLGYLVVYLKRTQFGPYKLSELGDKTYLKY